jgi:type IX secretion system PorP/SprF family membrane protein
MSSFVSYAQDIHFSQFLLAPFNLNPSLAGEFDGDYRLIGNYRNQWNSISVPYQTVGVAGDASNFARVNNLGAGVSIFNDRAGDSEYNTLIVQVVGAYAYPLTKDSSQKIHFGLQPSFVRQSLDVSKLYFDNQYNDQTGQFDPTLPSKDASGINSVNWVTLAAGLRWSFELNRRNRVDVGVAGYNLTGPSNSFENGVKGSLQRRYNIHGNFQFKLIDKMDLIPGFLYSTQGKNKNLVTGLSGRYLYNGVTAFHAGLWYRNKDSGFLSVGMTYQTLYVGMSYDITTSSLNDATGGRGAFELAIVYVFRKFKPRDGKYMSCPNYL